jgi:hypothetical protein
MSNQYERVWKTMIQMFGPQWTERWGLTNETWAEALKELTYAQVTVGLKAVRNSALKYYEVDLPAFMRLCRPVLPPVVQQAMTPPKHDWQNGMSQPEIDLNCWANLRMMSWAIRKQMRGPDFTKEQSRALWSSCRRLCKDFWEMRKELGEDKAPDSDLVVALERQWERDLQAGVSA